MDKNRLYETYQQPQYTLTTEEQILDPRAELWKEIAIAVAGSSNARDAVSMGGKYGKYGRMGRLCARSLR